MNERWELVAVWYGNQSEILDVECLGSFETAQEAYDMVSRRRRFAVETEASLEICHMVDDQMIGSAEPCDV